LGNKVDDDFSHRFLKCLPPRFDTLVTIIVRGGLKGVTPTQVLGDVVTQDTCHVEMEVVDKEDEKKKKKNVTFKVTTSSKGKSKKRKNEVMMKIKAQAQVWRMRDGSLCALVWQIHKEEGLWCKKKEIIIQKEGRKKML